jgi:hypothetical protein
VKITPDCSLLGNEFFPNFGLDCSVVDIFCYALVVGACLNHVEQRVHGVERIANDDYAFVSIELGSPDSFWEMGFHDPDSVTILAFSLQAHVFELLVHRSAEVTVRTCVNECQLLQVSPQESVAATRIACQNDFF